MNNGRWWTRSSITVNDEEMVVFTFFFFSLLKRATILVYIEFEWLSNEYRKLKDTITSYDDDE